VIAVLAADEPHARAVAPEKTANAPRLMLPPMKLNAYPARRPSTSGTLSPLMSAVARTHAP
jgi:hypothetical protein